MPPAASAIFAKSGSVRSNPSHKLVRTGFFGWVGGMAPLGYDTRDRKISVNEAEAEQVRSIFSSYLRLGSLNLLMADLRQQGIVTKVRSLKTGERVGGVPFTRGNSYVRYADANLATKHVFYMRLHCRNAGMICGRQALARKRGVIGWPFLC